MFIDETLYPLENAWEGALVPPSGVFAPRGKAMPKVSIGKPDWWIGREILGDAWKAPEGGSAMVWPGSPSLLGPRAGRR